MVDFFVPEVNMINILTWLRAFVYGLGDGDKIIMMAGKE